MGGSLWCVFPSLPSRLPPFPSSQTTLMHVSSDTYRENSRASTRQQTSSSRRASSAFSPPTRASRRYRWVSTSSEETTSYVLCSAAPSPGCKGRLGGEIPFLTISAFLPFPLADPHRRGRQGGGRSGRPFNSTSRPDRRVVALRKNVERGGLETTDDHTCTTTSAKTCNYHDTSLFSSSHAPLGRPKRFSQAC